MAQLQLKGLIAKIYLRTIRNQLQQIEVYRFIYFLMQNTDKQQLQRKRLDEIRQRVRQQGLNPDFKIKSQTDQNFILQCLKNHFIFYNLSEEELQNVKDYMWFTKIPARQKIFQQGQVGSCFFIIISGIVQISVDSQVAKQLKAGQGFGQLALLYDIQRPSKVIALQDCSLWVIDKVSFRDAVQEIIIKQFEDNQKYLEGIAFYQFLDNRQKQKVASSFVVLKYYKGQNIVEEGDPGSAFYIIKQGTASLIQGNIQERKIYKGQSFGLNSLYYNTMRKMTIRAQQQVTCQVLGRQTLAKIIGPQNFKQTMFKNYAKYTMQKNKQLFCLIKADQQRFFQNMRTRYYKTNQIVFKKGSVVHKLLIILQGRIKKFRSANFLAQSGQCWGQNYLNLQGNQGSFGKQTRLEDDIIVQTQSVLVQISLDSIRNVMNFKKQPGQSLKRERTKKIDLKQLSYQRALQKGQISSIYILANGQIPIIGKLFNKRIVQKEDYSKILSQHLDVLQQVQHPFLPQIYQTIDSQKYILILQQFISGQSMYDAIRDIGILSTTDCQFYVASMILLVQYLSSLEIVSRDLKPQNFILDQRGYLRLISLGSGKCIRDRHKTCTVIGTPHYMAPQIVLGKQYNQLSDLWSVGVMLYEFMLGQLPFGAYTQNPYQIYQQVIQGEVSFPRSFKDRRAKKIIQTFLCLNHQSRHNGQYSRLKNNSWFQNISWDQLYDKKASTPYKPKKVIDYKIDNKGKPLQQFLASIQL